MSSDPVRVEYPPFVTKQKKSCGRKKKKNKFYFFKLIEEFLIISCFLPSAGLLFP